MPIARPAHAVVRVALVLLIALASGSIAADVPKPESVLGFKPGADFHLAPWPTVVDYFQRVDATSDRVKVNELGKSTEGRPYLAAIISSPETISNLEKYQAFQAKLHDPRTLKEGAESDRIVAESKPVVVITCSIHSTETASTLMATELLHELATGNDTRTKEILDSTILILVPSANPDGVDKVAAWYERTKSHPWEGSGLPELYHKYAGHDTNRDWFMLNLKETQLLTKMLYKEWRPTVHYDVHQMGSRGARLFVPPFFDPINPNLDPRINQGIFLIGAHMASELADAGKQGVLTNAMYDNWWNGGNRTTPQRHNIVAVLTEAASVRLASPIFLSKDELRGTTRGFSEHKPTVNFVDPWPGGWWRIRDIIDYELICARSLLTLTARYHDRFQTNLLGMARDSIARGKSDPPYAWIVPIDQRDPGTAAEMVRILHDTGIEVHRAKSALEIHGSKYADGSWILYASQPYRTHLKDMMERQVYPNRLTAGGRAEAPYDVAGWTLPLQMGVRVVEMAEPFETTTERVDAIKPPPGCEVAFSGSSHHEGQDANLTPVYRITNESNDDAILVNALFKAGVEIKRVSEPGERSCLEVRKTEKAARVFESWLPKLSSRVRVGEVALRGQQEPLTSRRIGVYQPWMPSMDEGWTRLVLEKYGFTYRTLHNADIRAGNLHDRYDSLLIPGISARTLRDGYASGETEPAYVGGLGTEGTAALREFIQEGGTLVCLDASCEFAIEDLNLPVKNVVKGLSSSEFYGPGSILRARSSDPGDPILLGMPDEFSVYFDQSLAFELTTTKVPNAKILVKYADDHPLESGWLLGPAKIQGKGAVVGVNIGKGDVILFGFPPQHRGQTYGTFRLLFNALLQ
jgi:hypothetical protein